MDHDGAGTPRTHVRARGRVPRRRACGPAPTAQGRSGVVPPATLPPPAGVLPAGGVPAGATVTSQDRCAAFPARSAIFRTRWWTPAASRPPAMPWTTPSACQTCSTGAPSSVRATVDGSSPEPASLTATATMRTSPAASDAPSGGWGAPRAGGVLSGTSKRAPPSLWLPAASATDHARVCAPYARAAAGRPLARPPASASGTVAPSIDATAEATPLVASPTSSSTAGRVSAATAAGETTRGRGGCLVYPHGERQRSCLAAARVGAAHGACVDAVAERSRAEAQAGLRVGSRGLVLRARRRRVPRRGRPAAHEPDRAGARFAVAQAERRAHVAAMPGAVEQPAAVDPREPGRRRVLDRHDQPHERDVVVPRIRDQPGHAGMRVERDADLAEAAGQGDDVIGERRRLLLADERRRGIPGDSVGAHLHAREELRVPHPRPVRERAADDQRARRSGPLPAALRPDRLRAARARHDAVRRDVGTAGGRAAAAEQVAGLDVAAPAREIGGEVVRERVLAGMRGRCAGEDEQQGGHEWQEAEVWHAAIVGGSTVTCLCRIVPGAARRLPED